MVDIEGARPSAERGCRYRSPSAGTPPLTFRMKAQSTFPIIVLIVLIFQPF
jgi:hypothetical protein